MRWIAVFAGAYVLLAVLTRLAETVGIHKCGCSAGCWCQRPGWRRLFRWVFPFEHQPVDAHEKELRAGP